MKQTDLPIREIFNRFHLTIDTTTANRASVLCIRHHIENQVFAMAYQIDLNLHVE